ncbi:MAG: serine hydrolase [Endomicrobia bacterium]|nr:serine hydrolase [Endomicrobiia bacterium]MCL2506987.1 serine hydrolase [Endomicrobiia bacterium]
MRKFLSYLISIFIFSNLVFAQSISPAEIQDADIKRLVQSFDAHARKLQKEWNIPGMSVCMVVGDQIVYKRSFGVKEVRKDAKVTNKTIFQIASCTKSFTAVLTAILVDKGYLKWDDKVIKYLPDFRLHNKEISDSVTIEDLLAQNLPLPPYSQHLMMLFDYDKKNVIETMRYIQIKGTLGKQYSYQNNTYLVMGEVIKKATGKSWEANVREYIFKPLGMKSSSMDYKSYLKSNDRAIGHYYSGGKLTAISDSLPYNQWPYNFAPAGGINSNIDDMAKWLVFVMNNGRYGNKKLVSNANFNRLFEPKTFIDYDVYDKTKRNYYGLGWRYAEYYPENISWHAGVTDGQGAFVSFVRKGKIGIVVLMNLPNGKMADSLSRKLYDEYFEKPEVNWSSLKLKEAQKNANRRNAVAPPEVIVPHMDLKKYVGKYHNVLYGTAEVTLEGGKLMFSAGSMKTWITLKHFNNHSFDGGGIPGWRFKRPMFVFRVLEQSSVNGLVVEGMTDGVDARFNKIK